MADRFTTFRSTFEAMCAFPAEEMKRAYVMMGEYALDGILPNPEETAAYGLFCSVRPLIDTSVKRSGAGRSGGKATQEQHGDKVKANLKQNRSKTEANAHDSEACTEQKIKDKSIKIKDSIDMGAKPRFTPPTVDEVRAYIREKGYTVDAERFVDFYESKGWMIGKNKMKDWRAAVRNWNSKETKAPRNKFTNFPQRQYDYAELERKLRGLK